MKKRIRQFPTYYENFVLNLAKKNKYEYQKLVNRFFNKVILTANQKEITNSCWRWIAGKNEHGYGKFSIINKDTKAHRVSWLIHRGKIPKNLCVCHNCDNPECVNPNHLFLGTIKDNSDDKIKKGRHKGPKGSTHPNRQKTHCPQGHLYNKENTYVNPNTGHRLCRTCHRLYERNRKLVLEKGKTKDEC